ncbi:LytR/AlgR family response regulator transcription factor [Winogradskyella immobilis]|uniref:Response regulator transcription factor n=1 Tax=Winogradskyella immobilis TaxID=2816852 RepID=A0ABS8EM60_9FLAO|nr:response regulator transcription factor [Winogradskyella immobilis]MCC1483650.1 response regulator transcription factor [Winogradskyella immobilis]MCG0015744.1 response regulator transcription factor [Winogradskyella immobilis]
MAKTVSCIIVDDEAIARDIIASHLSKIENIEVVKQCKNAIEAFNFISNNTVDLVFLDINMPEISGIAFAKSINKNIKIIFTTAYRDYAVEGFDLQAVDYVMKPISFERLLQAVNRYFEVSSASQLDLPIKRELQDFIFVRADREMQKIDFGSIIYIESYSDYIKIYTRDTSTVLRHAQHDTLSTNRIIVTRETISSIEAKLPKSQFLRIHRSYIIAISQIEAFTNEHITINNKALSISRSYKKEVLKVLDTF